MIEHRSLSDLKAAPQNSRVHTEAQIDQIAASIKTFGWTIPVLIDEEGVIIAGHARVRAAAKMGITEAPCIVAAGWDENKKEAYQIADNRLAEMSEWDTSILENQIKRLNAVQFDLSFLDMSDFEFDLFAPTLAPEIKTGDATEDQMSKATSEQETFIKPTNAQVYTVMCPHCGEEFDVTL